MRRRQFLRGAAAASLAAGLSACTRKSDSSGPTTSSRKTFKWRLVMVIPKTLPIWGPGVVRFADRVREITQGDLDIKVFGAGELVPAFGTLEAVKAGQVEMGHSASYYWQGAIPAAAFFTAVPFGLNALGMRSWLTQGGGQELWDELYAPHGILAFPAGNTGVQMGGWFNREIRAPKDFVGLKMRIPGLGGNVLAKAGGNPILVPGGEIYTNLATGVIDATEWVGPYHDYVLGLHKVAKYYYYPGWQEPGPVLELMINKKAWDSLPKDLQQVVRSCAAELDRDLYAEWVAQDAIYYQKIKDETQVQVKAFPEEVLAKLSEYADQVKEEIAASSPIARKIYDSFLAFQKTFESYQEISEKAYIMARSG